MLTKKFKKVLFGGFDRADVMQYINQIQNESSAQIKELKKQNAELTKVSEELKEKTDGMQVELKDLTEKTEHLTEQNKALSDVNAELTDEINHQVGKIFTQARISSQNIINDAKEKAARIEEKSRETMKLAQGGLDNSKDAIGGAREEVEVLLDEVIEKLNTIFDSLDKPVIVEEKKEENEEIRFDIKKIPVRVSRRSPIRKVN